MAAGSAQSRTSGPMRTPPTMNTTTCGNRIRARSAETKGATAATSDTTRSVVRPVSTSIGAMPLCRPSGCLEWLGPVDLPAAPHVVYDDA